MFNPPLFASSGGVTLDNATEWLALGAEKVIVTSWLFENDVFSEDRAKALAAAVGPDRLVFDLSCRRRADAPGWFVGESFFVRGLA